MRGEFYESVKGLTSRHEISRVSRTVLEHAVKTITEITGIPVVERLIGSTQGVMDGKVTDSGDIDVAVLPAEYDKAVEAMKAYCRDSHDNPGIKVISFPLEVAGIIVQVDFMKVESLPMAKFGFFSSKGSSSAYNGSDRSICLAVVTAHTQKSGQDILIMDGGQLVARASRSYKANTGITRLFKACKRKADGSWTKALETVSPAEIQKIANEMGLSQKFSHDEDKISNPDDIAKYLFGQSATAQDLMTVEGIIKWIKKRKDASTLISELNTKLEKRVE